MWCSQKETTISTKRESRGLHCNSFCGKFYLCLKNQCPVYLPHGTHYRPLHWTQGPHHSFLLWLQFCFKRPIQTGIQESLSQAYSAAKACFNLCRITAGSEGSLNHWQAEWVAHRLLHALPHLWSWAELKTPKVFPEHGSDFDRLAQILRGSVDLTGSLLIY